MVVGGLAQSVQNAFDRYVVVMVIVVYDKT